MGASPTLQPVTAPPLSYQPDLSDWRNWPLPSRPLGYTTAEVMKYTGWGRRKTISKLRAFQQRGGRVLNDGALYEDRRALPPLSPKGEGGQPRLHRRPKFIPILPRTSVPILMAMLADGSTTPASRGRHSGTRIHQQRYKQRIQSREEQKRDKAKVLGLRRAAPV